MALLLVGENRVNVAAFIEQAIDFERVGSDTVENYIAPGTPIAILSSLAALVTALAAAFGPKIYAYFIQPKSADQSGE
jgi:hypothetical protein